MNNTTGLNKDKTKLNKIESKDIFKNLKNDLFFTKII